MRLAEGFVGEVAHQRRRQPLNVGHIHERPRLPVHDGVDGPGGTEADDGEPGGGGL